MDATSHPSHSFILKIWLEHTIEEVGHAEWRGHLTHVPDGQRRYIRTLPELCGALAPYLDEMGVEFVPRRHRVLQWLLNYRGKRRA